MTNNSDNLVSPREAMAPFVSKMLEDHPDRDVLLPEILNLEFGSFRFNIYPNSRRKPPVLYPVQWKIAYISLRGELTGYEGFINESLEIVSGSQHESKTVQEKRENKERLPKDIYAGLPKLAGPLPGDVLPSKDGNDLYDDISSTGLGRVLKAGGGTDRIVSALEYSMHQNPDDFFLDLIVNTRFRGLIEKHRVPGKPLSYSVKQFGASAIGHALGND